MEKEARLILADADDRGPAPVEGLGTAINELFKPFGEVKLESPPGQLTRDPPRLE